MKSQKVFVVMASEGKYDSHPVRVHFDKRSAEVYAKKLNSKAGMYGAVYTVESCPLVVEPGED